MKPPKMENRSLWLEWSFWVYYAERISWVPPFGDEELNWDFALDGDEELNWDFALKHANVPLDSYEHPYLLLAWLRSRHARV